MTMSRDAHRRGLMAAALCTALAVLAGCRQPSRVEIVQPNAAVTQEDTRSVLQRLASYREAVNTFQANLGGRIVWQAKLSEFKRPPNDAAFDETLTARISTGYILARRESGEQRQTLLVATFPRFRAVIEMLAIDQFWWLRKFQPTRRFISGLLDPVDIRPKEWTSIRPQDIGTLLFYDDLFPEEVGQKQTVYMETWPRFYIVHVLRINQVPEPIYSRIWIDRDSLQVFSHQLFEADGELIAEARFSNYKEVAATPQRAWRPGSGERKTISVPGNVLLYWPRDRFAFDLMLKNVQLNGEIKAEHFSPPDAKGGAQITNIDMEKTP